MADGSGRLPELSPSPSKGSFAKEQFRGGANVNFGPMPKKRPKELPSHQRSMLGKMVDSNKRTGPTVGFGTAKRWPTGDRSIHKQYISKEHTHNSPGQERTPGPIYDLESSMGRQRVSHRRSSYFQAFSRGSRFGAQEMEQRHKGKQPDPGAYPVEAAHGRQISSLHMTEPTVIIGRESRDARASVGKAFEQTLHGRFTPGPAYYTPASGHGKQVYSGKANPPAIGFCKEMLYTDPKRPNPDERRARAIPGPGQYKLVPAVGKQHVSLKSSAPVFAFGTATRDQAAVASMDKKREVALLGGRDAPGPGMYNDMRSSIKFDMNSTKPTAPTIRFGSGEKLQLNRSTAHLGPGPGTYVV